MMLIIGDSFIDGVGATDKFGWSQMLRQNHPGKIELAGVPGDTIQKVNMRLPRVWNNFQTVVLAVGINDSRFRPSLNQTELKLNDYINGLSGFRDFCFSRGASVIAVGLTRVDETRTVPYKADRIYKNEDINAFDRELEKFCRNSNARYLKVPPLNDQADHYLFDGLHPNDNGHSLLFHHLKATLGALL